MRERGGVGRGYVVDRVLSTLWNGASCMQGVPAMASPGDLFCTSPHSKGSPEMKVCPRAPNVPMAVDPVGGLAERPVGPLFETILGGVTR